MDANANATKIGITDDFVTAVEKLILSEYKTCLYSNIKLFCNNKIIM